MENNMNFFGRRILFVGAHPDDIELGCGALISHIGNRAEIRCVTLSDNQKNPDLKYIVEEHYRSMAVLGVPENKVELGKFITRNFPILRQEILEFLINIKKTFQPDIVFTHTTADIHQDHHTVMEETLRAFRGTTVLGFDVLRSSYGFFPNFLVGVTEQDVNKKLAALAEYKTYALKYYFDPDVTKATLIRNGALAERPYAEGFDILRIIGSFSCP
jgi:LmbE family N-acetylglucosaminyl deacetylase